MFFLNIKVPGPLLKRCRIIGKTVKVRHMPAVAVIGDRDCSMPLFRTGGRGLKRGRRSYQDDP